MKLTQLEPQFIRYETRIEQRTFRNPDGSTEERTSPVRYSIHVASVSEAQGIYFLCPKCFAENAGPVGTHGCEVSFADRGVKDEDGSHGNDGKPTRWSVSGDSCENLTLSPSILLGGGCAWHGHVTNGEITP
jgi:Family of unknown function (DUF6527)